MKQSGIALVTGLLLLASCSLLAITAARGMTLHQRQSSNFADKARAESNALLAESWARAWLYSRNSLERQSDCLAPCFLPPAIHPPGALAGQPELLGPAWWLSHGAAAGINPVNGKIATGFSAYDGESQWVLQEIYARDTLSAGPDSEIVTIGYYRLLSRGSGRQSGSVVVTEAIVARPWTTSSAPLEFPPQVRLHQFCDQFPPALACGTQSWRQLR